MMIFIIMLKVFWKHVEMTLKIRMIFMKLLVRFFTRWKWIKQRMM